MDRSSLRRTYDTTQRTKYIALAAGAVGFVVLWVLIVVWLGKVGSAESSETAASSAPATTTTEETPGASQAPQSTTGQETDQGGGDADGSGADDGVRPGETLGGGAESSAENGSQTGQSAGGGAQPGEVFDPLEEDTEGTAPTGTPPSLPTTDADPQTAPLVSAEPAEDTADTSGSSSTADTGTTADTEDTEDTADTAQSADASAITGTDVTSARAASEHYLTAAYGYTGTSAEDYLAGIEEVASEAVFGSPGGEKLEGYSQAAPACGMVSTVILDGFEVIGNDPDGLDALTTFSVQDADGQTHRFKQQHRLGSSGGAYRVSAVSVEELISDTTPRESCPGSASEDLDDEGSGEPEEELDAHQKEQLRSAADRFITAAYGYTGGSEKEYREGIERTTVSGGFFESPGGGRIAGYAETAGEEGIQAAARMERFQITGASGEDVEGVAYFEVGSAYDRYANVTGETTAYRQRLTLNPYEGSYRVLTAAAEEEIDDVRATGHDNERKLTK